MSRNGGASTSAESDAAATQGIAALEAKSFSNPYHVLAMELDERTIAQGVRESALSSNAATWVKTSPRMDTRAEEEQFVEVITSPRPRQPAPQCLPLPGTAAAPNQHYIPKSLPLDGLPRGESPECPSDSVPSSLTSPRQQQLAPLRHPIPGLILLPSPPRLSTPQHVELSPRAGTPQPALELEHEPPATARQHGDGEDAAAAAERRPLTAEDENGAAVAEDGNGTGGGGGGGYPPPRQCVRFDDEVEDGTGIYDDDDNSYCDGDGDSDSEHGAHGAATEAKAAPDAEGNGSADCLNNSNGSLLSNSIIALDAIATAAATTPAAAVPANTRTGRHGSRLGRPPRPTPPIVKGRVLQQLEEAKLRLKSIDQGMTALVDRAMAGPPPSRYISAQESIAKTLRRRRPSLMLTKEPILVVPQYARPPHLRRNREREQEREGGEGGGGGGGGPTSPRQQQQQQQQQQPGVRSPKDKVAGPHQPGAAEAEAAGGGLYEGPSMEVSPRRSDQLHSSLFESYSWRPAKRVTVMRRVEAIDLPIPAWKLGLPDEVDPDAEAEEEARRARQRQREVVWDRLSRTRNYTRNLGTTVDDPAGSSSGPPSTPGGPPGSAGRPPASPRTPGLSRSANRGASPYAPPSSSSHPGPRPASQQHQRRVSPFAPRPPSSTAPAHSPRNRPGAGPGRTVSGRVRAAATDPRGSITGGSAGGGIGNGGLGKGESKSGPQHLQPESEWPHSKAHRRASHDPIRSGTSAGGPRPGPAVVPAAATGSSSSSSAALHGGAWTSPAAEMLGQGSPVVASEVPPQYLLAQQPEVRPSQQQQPQRQPQPQPQSQPQQLPPRVPSPFAEQQPLFLSLDVCDTSMDMEGPFAAAAAAVAAATAVDAAGQPVASPDPVAQPSSGGGHDGSDSSAGGGPATKGSLVVRASGNAAAAYDHALMLGLRVSAARAAGTSSRVGRVDSPDTAAKEQEWQSVFQGPAVNWLRNIKTMLNDIQSANARLSPYLPSYVANRISRASRSSTVVASPPGSPAANAAAIAAAAAASVVSGPQSVRSRPPPVRSLAAAISIGLASTNSGDIWPVLASLGGGGGRSPLSRRGSVTAGSPKSGAGSPKTASPSGARPRAAAAALRDDSGGGAGGGGGGGSGAASRASSARGGCNGGRSEAGSNGCSRAGSARSRRLSTTSGTQAGLTHGAALAVAASLEILAKELQPLHEHVLMEAGQQQQQQQQLRGEEQGGRKGGLGAPGRQGSKGVQPQASSASALQQWASSKSQLQDTGGRAVSQDLESPSPSARGKTPDATALGIVQGITAPRDGSPPMSPSSPRTPVGIPPPTSPRAAAPVAAAGCWPQPPSSPVRTPPAAPTVAVGRARAFGDASGGSRVGSAEYSESGGGAGVHSSSAGGGGGVPMSPPLLPPIGQRPGSSRSVRGSSNGSLATSGAPAGGGGGSSGGISGGSPIGSGSYGGGGGVAVVGGWIRPERSTAPGSDRAPSPSGNAPRAPWSPAGAAHQRRPSRQLPSQSLDGSTRSHSPSPGFRMPQARNTIDGTGTGTGMGTGTGAGGGTGSSRYGWYGRGRPGRNTTDGTGTTGGPGGSISQRVGSGSGSGVGASVGAAGRAGEAWSPMRSRNQAFLSNPGSNAPLLAAVGDVDRRQQGTNGLGAAG